MLSSSRSLASLLPTVVTTRVAIFNVKLENAPLVTSSLIPILFAAGSLPPSHARAHPPACPTPHAHTGQATPRQFEFQKRLCVWVGGGGGGGESNLIGGSYRVRLPKAARRCPGGVLSHRVAPLWHRTEELPTYRIATLEQHRILHRIQHDTIRGRNQASKSRQALSLSLCVYLSISLSASGRKDRSVSNRIFWLSWMTTALVDLPVRCNRLDAASGGGSRCG